MNIAASIIIVVLALAYLFLLFVPRKRAEKEAWLWWYIPCWAVLYAIVTVLIYPLVHIEQLVTGLLNLFSVTAPEPYLIEAFYCLLVCIVWIPLSCRLRRANNVAKMKDWAIRHWGDEDSQQAKLFFPYIYGKSDANTPNEMVVKSREGLLHYRWALKIFVILVAAVYAVAFAVMSITRPHLSYLASALPLIALLPVVEYYVYLCAKVEAVEAEEEVDEPTPVPLDEGSLHDLWQQYIDLFDNYSVAWYKKQTPSTSAIQDNNRIIASVIEILQNGNNDCILQDLDLVSAFSQLEPLFTVEDTRGKHVLIALDIPSHFTFEETPYLEAIADGMRTLLNREIDVFSQADTRDVLKGSVALAPLSLLLRERMEPEWLAKLGLIVVVSIDDRVVSNLFECRKFSYILKAANKDCRLLSLTPRRMGAEPSLANTWLTSTKIREARVQQIVQASNIFLIAYNTEDFLLRRDKILTGIPNEAMYAGSELAPLALNDDIPYSIHYLDPAYTNIVEGKEELKKNHDILDHDRFKQVSVRDYIDRIIIHHIPIDKIDDKLLLAVVTDQENNGPAAYRKWRHLGTEENLSIILSKPYLLRDYFNANHDYFVEAPMSAIQPHLSNSRVTLAIILYHRLEHDRMNGMEETELRHLLGPYYDQEEIVSVSAIVKELFIRYFGDDLARNLYTENGVILENDHYKYQTFYRLATDARIRQSYLDNIVVRDRAGNPLFEIIRDLVFQNFDFEQIHSFSGRPYKILSFDDTTKTLTVEVANDAKGILFYRPAMVIHVGDNRVALKGLKCHNNWVHHITGQNVSLCIEGFETQVDIVILKWYEFSRHTSVGNGCHDIAPIEQRTRSYRNGRVMKMTFGFIPKPEYIERRNDIRRSLQLLLYEAMRSFFPHHAQYLLISTLGEGDNSLPWIFNPFHCNDRDGDCEISVYFIEDANIDLGLIGALSEKENITNIFRYIYDYLEWVADGEQQTSPNGYAEYMLGKWFDRKSFLRYGRPDLPAWLDPVLIVNFLRDISTEFTSLNENRVKRILEKECTGTGTCDFCGKEHQNSEMQRLDDGRMRCSNCSDGAIDTQEQFHALCNTAKELFLQHLGIDFRSIPHTAKLVSAVQLHSLGHKPFSITNGYDTRKIVGLAFDKYHDEFYVENGYSQQNTLAIICHEMTHIWQYNTPSFNAYRNDENWVEGLAVWTDLYLSEKAGATNIDQLREGWLAMNNEYGRGLRMILNLCPDNPYEYIAGH